MNVMVRGPNGIPYTAPLNGTSGSAAIVSGTAAAVWSVLPNLDASEVMGLVYGAGVALDGGERSKRARTEFCLGEHFGPCLDQRVHRAFLCGALSQALAAAGANETLTCDTTLPTEQERPMWPATRLTGQMVGPCRVAACGMPLGPLPGQRVTGIASHGFANCPGCGFSINLATLLGTLHGTPLATGTLPSSYLAAVVDVAARRSFVSYTLNPAPPFGLPMSQPQMSNVPSNASAATITWYYYTGLIWVPDVPQYLDVTFE